MWCCLDVLPLRVAAAAVAVAAVVVLIQERGTSQVGMGVWLDVPLVQVLRQGWLVQQLCPEVVPQVVGALIGQGVCHHILLASRKRLELSPPQLLTMLTEL